MRASSHLGFTMEWYDERGQFWVIRTMRVEQRGLAEYRDDLEIRTWVSAMTRVRADRNYLVRRVPDGRVVARATAGWVYLDRKSMHPARIAPEIVAMFVNPEGPAVPRQWRLKTTLEADLNLSSRTTRRAAYYEADSAKHTNNAVYADWLEESVRQTLASNGYFLGPECTQSIRFYRHSIEYLSPALPGDDLEITTQLIGRGSSAGRWRQEIRKAITKELVASGECVTLWLDNEGRAVRWKDFRNGDD